MSEQDIIRIPSLAGGVSRQPPHVRFPEQVEDAENVRFSVVDGASKRPPTEYVLEFDPSAGDGADLRLHPIDRDENERWSVLYGPNAAGTSFILVVRDSAGAAVTVNRTTDANTYLNDSVASAAASDYRLVTIGDTTLILNAKVEAVTASSDSYSVQDSVRDYEALLSIQPTIVNQYFRTEEDGGGEIPGHWKYTPDGDHKYAYAQFTTVTGEWASPRGNWNDTGVGEEQPGGFRISRSRDLLTGFTAAAWDLSDRTIIKAGAFTNYTFYPKDSIYITAGTGFTVGWYLIESRTSANQIVLAEQRFQRHTLPADAADLAANSADGCRIGGEIEVVCDFSGTNAADTMYDIAYGIQKEMRSQGWENSLCAWNPTVGGGFFSITSSFRGANARIYAPSAPSATVNDWTNDAADPFYLSGVTLVAGTGTLASDDEPSRPPETRWTRVAAPNQPDAKFTPTSMPVAMTYNRSGPDIGEFSVDVIDWDQRLSGDELTNKAPTPLLGGEVIEDICYFEGRLVLASGEYVIFSEADNLYNFFLDDPSNVVDSDRISKSVGTNRVANIEYLVPNQKTLVAFTKGGEQYEVAFGDALTPTSVSITRATTYKTKPVRPVTMGPFMYFISESGNRSVVWEYFFDEATAATAANSITMHVGDFIPTNIRSIVGDSVQQALVLIPEADTGTITSISLSGDTVTVTSANHGLAVGDPIMVSGVDGEGGTPFSNLNGWHAVTAVTQDTFQFEDTDATGGPATTGTWRKTVYEAYVYRTHWDGTKRVHSAWGRYEFDSTYEIRDVAFLGGDIYIMAQIASAYTLERLPMEPTAIKPGFAYEVHLDRQRELTGVLDGSDTDFDVSPIPATGSTYNALVKQNGTLIVNGDSNGAWTYSSNTVTVPGNHTASSVIMGRYYDAFVTLTRPYRRDERNRALTGERMLINRMWVEHRDSGMYRAVIASSEHTTDRDEDWSPTGDTGSGFIEAYVRQDADHTTITVGDDFAAVADVTATPWTISGVEYDVEITRGVR